MVSKEFKVLVLHNDIYIFCWTDYLIFPLKFPLRCKIKP